jgi:predicted ATPase/DNA-binding CsgD family transcriptional regulator
VELAAGRALLLDGGARLLTLAGPPGIGKTRLAVALAAGVAPAFADGVCWAPLAAVRDAAAVPGAVARALGLLPGVEGDVGDAPAGGAAAVAGARGAAGTAGGAPAGAPPDWAGRVREALSDCHLLLVLDNCEQVAAAGAFVARLVASCPGLAVLATSRAPLRVAAERELPVPPLSLPPAPPPAGWHAASPAGLPLPAHPAAGAVDQETGAGTSGGSEAVALFLERARAAVPGFAPTPAQAAAVAAVCRRLEGVPLAIELAAARVRVLSPDALLAQLERRLPLLTGGARDLPARHRTLRDAVAWSYDLLTPGEQALFRRLGVFVGGCALTEAAIVAAGGLAQEEPGGDAALREDQAPVPVELVDGLEALVAGNLLQRDSAGQTERLGGPLGETPATDLHKDGGAAPPAAGPGAGGGGPRFRMLELVREYALERLEAAGEAPAVRWRHALAYTALAERGGGGLKTAAQPAWADRLERDQDNLRAALDWLTAAAAPAPGSDSALPGQTPGDGAGGAAAAGLGLRLAGALWWYWHLTGRIREGRAALTTLLALPAAGAPTPARALALFGAGFLGWSSTNFLRWDVAERQAARAFLEESLALSRAAGDRHGEAYARWGLGLVVVGLDQVTAPAGTSEAAGAPARWASALPHVEAALDLFRAVGDRWGVVKALERLVHPHEQQADLAAARRLLEEALAVAQTLGEPQSVSGALRGLGYLAHQEGDLAGARRLHEESLAVQRAAGLRSPRAITHFALGHVAFDAGDLADSWAHGVEALAWGRAFGSRPWTAWALLTLGATAGAAGEPAWTLRLAGAAAAVAQGAPEEGPLPAAEARRAVFDQQTAQRHWPRRAREALGDAAALAAWEEGWWAPPERLVRDAATRGVPGALPAPAGRAARALPGGRVPVPRRGLPADRDAAMPPAGGLTPREREVVALVARGLTNREVAAALVVAERTVVGHLEHVMAKLGLRTRTQVAVWAVEHGVR